MWTGVKTERTTGDVTTPEDRRRSAETRESAEESDRGAARDACEENKCTDSDISNMTSRLLILSNVTLQEDTPSNQRSNINQILSGTIYHT